MAINEIKFFYKEEAFNFAFKDTNSEIIITKEGDVYKDSITDFNLVVSAGGEIGPAGGGPVPVKINDINQGALTNGVEYTCQLGEYYVRQINLNTAVAKDLDFIGRDIYGIERRAGEGDAAYRRRIVDTVFAIKGTPVAIREALLPFADEVLIDDDASSGAFADVTFSDYYREFDPPDHELVRGAMAGTFGGIIFEYNVFLTNPDLSRKNEILRLLKSFTVGGVTYNIFVD